MVKRYSYNSYYSRRRRALKESANAALSAVTVFAERLEGLCDTLDWLRDNEADFDIEGLTIDDKVRLGNAVKSAHMLAGMYSKDDAFIPEISYESGYLADKAFSVKSDDIYGMEFAETLEYIADTLDEIIDDDDFNAEAWGVVKQYIPLVRLFCSQMRRDYGV